MWGVGICERCGTVTAFRTTTPTARSLARLRTYYCPICGLYKLLKVQAVPNAEALDDAYNQLRIGIILNNESEGERYNASEQTTSGLISAATSKNSR